MNLKNMMKQAQDIQNKLAEAQHKLASVETEGSSGGGLVTAVVNGDGKMRSITINPSVINPDDKEMLEDLIVAAFNDAKTKSDANASEELARITGSLGLPPGMKLPF